jgi:hypothetical protein
VQCECLGNDESGLQKVLPLLASPYLVTVKDTYVRFEKQHTQYSDSSFRDWTAALRKFAIESRSRTNNVPCVYEIFGGYIQSAYIRHLINAAKNEKNAVKFNFHELKEGRGPIMNFIILEYQPGSAADEVFFGWGRYNRSSPEAVFRSTDPMLVKEFKTFFDVLLDRGASRQRKLSDLHVLRAKLESVETLQSSSAVRRKRPRA